MKIKTAYKQVLPFLTVYEHDFPVELQSVKNADICRSSTFDILQFFIFYFICIITFCKAVSGQ